MLHRLPPSSARRGGFTLLEMMIGLAIGSLVLTGLSAVMMSLQRSFEAANYQMTAQNDQLRVLDYVTRDVCTASTLALLNGGGKITATIPAGSNVALNLNLVPLLTSVLTNSGSTTGMDTVSYYAEGGNFIRELNGVQTVLATTVADLSFVRQGSFLTTSILFTPQFSASPTTASQQNTRATTQTFLRNSPASN